MGAALRKVLASGSYRERALEISRLMQARRWSPAEVAASVSAPHLISASLERLPEACLLLKVTALLAQHAHQAHWAEAAKTL